MSRFKCTAFILAALLLFGAAPAFAACNTPAGKNSQTRYDFVAHKMYICDGTTWLEIPGGAGGGTGCALGGVQVGNGNSFDFYNTQSHSNCNSVRLSRTCTDGVLSGSGAYQYATCANLDTTPNAFSFTDLNGLTAGVLTSSNIIQITGMSDGTAISIAGGPEYRICQDAACSTVIATWTTSSSTIDNNRYVQLRGVSNASAGGTVNTVLTIGTVADTWTMTTAAAGDTTPNAFSFTDVTGAALNTLTTPSPATVTISGIDASTPVSVSGQGSPQININGGGWVTSGSITNGQSLAVRLTSANAGNTAYSATINVGGVTDSWSVTTADTMPNAFSFTDQTGVALSTPIDSNIVQITGINGPAPITMTGGTGYRICSDAACSTVVQTWGSSAGTITNNQYVQLRMTSAAGNNQAAAQQLTIGGISDTWDITTIAADTTPNAFSFTDQTGVATSSLINSNIIQITGITGPSPITFTGTGAYRVCGDATCSSNPSWQSTTVPGNILNNNYLQVRVTSSGSANTAVNLVVNVGGVTDTWSVTTVAPDTTPDAFTFTDVPNANPSIVYDSNIVQITGIAAATPISIISGAPTAYYRICNNATCSSVAVAWTQAANNVVNGHYIQARVTSAAAANSTDTHVDNNIEVGGVGDMYRVTTRSHCVRESGIMDGAVCYFLTPPGYSCAGFCAGNIVYQYYSTNTSIPASSDFACQGTLNLLSAPFAPSAPTAIANASGCQVNAVSRRRGSSPLSSTDTVSGTRRVCSCKWLP